VHARRRRRRGRRDLRRRRGVPRARVRRRRLRGASRGGRIRYTFAPSISAEELETGRGISLTYSSARLHTLSVAAAGGARPTVTWAEVTAAGDAWPPRGGHAAVALGGDRVLLCGGGVQRAWLPQDAGSPHEEDLDDCFLLDTETWALSRVRATLPSPRGGHSAALAPVRAGGRWDLGVLLFGGRDFDAATGTHRGRDDLVLLSLLGDEAAGP